MPHPDLFGRHVPGLDLEQPLYEGHAEGAGLARPGPAAGQQVLALKDQGHGPLLQQRERQDQVIMTDQDS